MLCNSGAGSGSGSGSGCRYDARVFRRGPRPGCALYRVSLDACRTCAPIAASLTANLKDQLLRASASVVLNIAEGFGSSSRGVKRRHYEIARGSAVECIAVLDLAAALSFGDGTGLAAARTLFTRVAMMLSRLEARFR